MKSARVSSNVIHQSEWEVFGVQDTKIGTDTIVSPLVTHTLLQKGDKLLIVAKLLVMLNEIFQMIWKDNDVQTTFAGCGKLLGSDAREAYSFPNLWDVSFLSRLECLNILLEHHLNLSELLVVSNSLEKNFGRYV